MKIRPLMERDFEEVHTLLLEVHRLHQQNRPDFYRDADPMNRQEFLEMLENPAMFTLVAEEDGKVAGYCTVTMREPSANPVLQPRRIAWMEELCVAAGYRRHGIGEILMKAAECEAKQRGAEKIELMVWVFNDSAENFYQKMGMSPRASIMEKTL